MIARSRICYHVDYTYARDISPLGHLPAPATSIKLFQEQIHDEVEDRLPFLSTKGLRSSTLVTHGSQVSASLRGAGVRGRRQLRRSCCSWDCPTKMSYRSRPYSPASGSEQTAGPTLPRLWGAVIPADGHQSRPRPTMRTVGGRSPSLSGRSSWRQGRNHSTGGLRRWLARGQLIPHEVTSVVMLTWN